MKHAIYLFLTCALGVSACGDDDEARAPAPVPGEPAAEAIAAAEEVAGQTVTVGDHEEPDPCALLTEEILRTTFDVPAETVIDQQPSMNSIRPICTYGWEKPNAAELSAQIREQQAKQVQDMIQQLRRGKQAQSLTDLAMNLPNVENRISLNFSPPPESAEQARSMFESAMETMERGISHTIEVDEDDEGVSETVRREVNGQEITVQADTVVVEGIGDEARWLERMNQLAVLDGARILYLTVDMDPDRSVNRERAEQLARALLAAD